MSIDVKKMPLGQLSEAQVGGRVAGRGRAYVWFVYDFTQRGE